jgi:hypothetical protein
MQGNGEEGWVVREREIIQSQARGLGESSRRALQEHKADEAELGMGGKGS